MYEVFSNYLNNRISITHDQHEFIRSCSVIKKMRKKQYLLQEGDTWKYNAFITKGLLRTYSIDDRGIEHVLSFAMEEWWVGDREALLSGKPSRFHIDAIEDSQIILFEKEKFNTICKEIPAFNEMVTNIIQHSFIALQNRLNVSISTSVEERYENFIYNYPSFASRVPQSMIASYLGITRETLSRTRNKVAKKP